MGSEALSKLSHQNDLIFFIQLIIQLIFKYAKAIVVCLFLIF